MVTRQDATVPAIGKDSRHVIRGGSG
jgi:hypothetical protein